MTPSLIRAVAPRLAMLVSSVIAMLAVVVFTQIELGYRILEKYPPDWSLPGFTRMAGCILVAYLILLAVRPPETGPRRIAGRFADEPLFPAMYLASLALIVVTAVSSVVSPATLNMLALENGPTENLSVALLGVAAILFGWTALRLRGSTTGALGPIGAPVVLAAGAFVAFLIMMEEISWGQQALKFATPGWFEGNLQEETNLHNFHTNKFELFYYSAAVGLFVLLPLFWPRRTPDAIAPLEFYVPPVWFAALSLPVCSYLYETWNVVPLMVIFFLAIFAALDHLRRDGTSGGRARAPLAIMVVAALAAQAGFLAGGEDFVRSYDLTEMREFHISLLVFAYAGWIAGKA